MKLPPVNWERILNAILAFMVVFALWFEMYRPSPIPAILEERDRLDAKIKVIQARLEREGLRHGP